MKSLTESILKKYQGKISIGSCSRNELNNLIEFDHHVVNGEKGVLITYHLMDIKNNDNLYELIVVHEHVDNHPIAPTSVNEIIHKLTWNRT